MTMGARIKKVRQEKHLTQQVFADKIGTTQNTITRYETDTRTPPNAVISLICREFHVNEAWLRTGEGEMFLPEMESLLLEDASLDEFDRSLLQSYIKAPKELRAYIRKMVLDAAEKARHASPSIDEKVEAYRKELEAEEKAKERSSASPDTGEESA